MNLDFGKYYEAPEPGRRERAHAWATAIGLQDVDGLKPSKYLIEMAKEHIEGRITIDEVIKRIDEYYDKRKVGQEYGTSDSEAVKGLQQHYVVVNDVINRRGARKNGEWYFETGANQQKMDAAQISRIKAAAFSPS